MLLSGLSGPCFRRAFAKFVWFTFALPCFVALTGCWVTSINPLYEDGKDPDVVVESGLVGTWSLTDEDQCATTLTIAIKNHDYELRSVQSRQGCSDVGKMALGQGELVKLGDHEFLDVAPRPEDVCDSCVARHEIYEAKIDENALELIPIDSEWLQGAINSKIVALPAMPDDTDTVTASSKDLKAFCRQYADDPEVFKPVGLVFSRN
jgi:hypothetical protein